MILTIRTDNPEAEISLCNRAGKVLATKTWQAHRQLGATIHQQIDACLKQSDQKYSNLSGIVVYKGPGSFTGLRIGMSVANALAYSYQVPIVATTGSDWAKTGLQKLSDAKVGIYVLPEYGAGAHITQPKK